MRVLINIDTSTSTYLTHNITTENKTVIVYINDDITLEIEGTNNVGGSSTTASVPPISYIKVISRDDLFNIKIIDNIFAYLK